MRVLVVDDDPVLLTSVRRWLTAAGMVVDTAATAGDALRRAQTGVHDVLVLDVMLGEQLDGYAVCARLRDAAVGMPILMLTARDAVSDRVRGLQAGADDYLVKPYALEELEARVQALARRHLADRSAVLRFGDVSFDTAAHRAEAGGRTLRLTEKETALLRHLLLHPRSPQSQAAIFAGVWGYSEAPMSNLVDQYVVRLRRKLAAAGSEVSVVARKGRGYSLEAVAATERPRGRPQSS